MSVRKRILPSGEIRWLVDYRDGGGKRRFKQFATQKEATAFRDATGVAVRAGMHIADAASVTVAKAGELWLDRCRLDGLEAGTLRNYKQHLDLHILPLIGGVKLSKLTKPGIVAFRNKLLETHSKVMAAKAMVSLKSLLSNAQERGLVAQNVATGVKVKVNSRDKKRIEIPEKDEIRAMVAKVNEWPINEPWRPFMLTALFTGLRPSELRGLVWDCVDFDKKLIRVHQRADFRGTMGHPKSEAGNRDVPLAPMVLNALRQWRLACPKTEAGLVFPAKHGGVIGHTEVWRMWNQLLEAIGLPRKHHRLYDLRHVAASLFIEQGMQPKKIKTIMGHSSIRITFDLYGHLWETPEKDAKAMEEIETRLLHTVK